MLFLRHSVGYVFIYMFLSLELSDFDQINVLKRRNVFHEPICWILMLPKSRSGSENGKYRRRSLLAFTVLSLHTLSVAFLKHTVSSRFTASGSAKCLKFGNWLTMCTLNIALTYLLITYLWTQLTFSDVEGVKTRRLDVVDERWHFQVRFQFFSSAALSQKAS